MLNLAKWEFVKATVMYLGKEVGQGKVRPVSTKVEAITAFPFLPLGGNYKDFWVWQGTI